VLFVQYAVQIRSAIYLILAEHFSIRRSVFEARFSNYFQFADTSD